MRVFEIRTKTKGAARVVAVSISMLNMTHIQRTERRCDVMYFASLQSMEGHFVNAGEHMDNGCCVRLYLVFDDLRRFGMI